MPSPLTFLEQRIKKARQWLEYVPIPINMERIGLESDIKRVRYCPWSQTEYLIRCSSFDWTWASRPPPIDPMTCARHGWRGDPHDSQLIHCTSCQGHLYLPWEEDGEGRDILIAEYGEQIREQGHKNGCPWRIRPANPNLGLASYFGPIIERDLLLNRYCSFAKVVVNIPSNASYPTLSNTITLLDDGNIDETFKDLEHFTLALLQWHVSSQVSINDAPVVQCRFGCSTFTITDQQVFDPVENHLYYCPFLHSGGLDVFLKIFISTEGSRTESLDYYPLITGFTTRQIEQLLNNNKQSKL